MAPRIDLETISGCQAAAWRLTHSLSPSATIKLSPVPAVGCRFLPMTARALEFLHASVAGLDPPYVRSFNLPDRYLWITLDRSV